ncbi:hypothetical protein HZ994_06515 [Akkermansiaceae bacterium]|nr:hypothetical protein HZ994_06515 [Akkermansiaceae bacterium]
MHPAVYWGVAAAWLLLLISAFMSVRSLSIATAAKVAWFLAILALPILGLAAYALRCLLAGNWQIIAPFFQSRRLDRQISRTVASGNPAAKA